MKVPFRQQVSDYDCVPTSMINALSYLFARGEFPPFLVHRVYRDLLDVEGFRGTSGRAIQDIGFWLNHYKEKRYKKFAVESEFITGDHVHLRSNSKIIRCINANGAAVMRVHMTRNEWHSIIGLRSDGEWVHFYDPAPRTKRLIDNDAVQILATTQPQDPNLRIRIDWLEKDFHKTQHSDERKYVLGCSSERECLLVNRIVDSLLELKEGSP